MIATITNVTDIAGTRSTIEGWFGSKYSGFERQAGSTTVKVHTTSAGLTQGEQDSITSSATAAGFGVTFA